LGPYSPLAIVSFVQLPRAVYPAVPLSMMMVSGGSALVGCRAKLLP
jgi:hypothetical protein